MSVKIRGKRRIVEEKIGLKKTGEKACTTKKPGEKMKKILLNTNSLLPLGTILLLFLVSGCTASQFDADQLCAKIPGVSAAAIGETVVGAACSDSLQQLFSAQETAAIRQSKYAGVLNQNTLVEFSCTVHGTKNAKTFSLDYALPQSCESQPCQSNPDEKNVPQATCGPAGQPVVVQQTNAPGTDCPNGGFTGAQAAPRNKFSWTFATIAPDECDATNPSHANCDMTQFLLSFFQKMNLVEKYANSHAVSDAVLVEKTGSLAPAPNGFDLEFDTAFLSDNLSYQLLSDFGQSENGFFDEPSWYKEQWHAYLTNIATNPPIRIEYGSPSLNRVNALHEAGWYHVKTRIRFKTPGTRFFAGSGKDLAPNATITLVLTRTTDLPDQTVLDLALNGNLGFNDGYKDFGVEFPQLQNQPPIAIAFSPALAGVSQLDSANYPNGLGFISLPQENNPRQLSFSAFYTPPTTVSSATEPLFFNNMPVLLQTIETTTDSTPTQNTQQTRDKEYFLAFTPITATPVLAVSPPSNSVVLGANGFTADYGFWGPWVSIAQGGTQCEKATRPSVPQTATNCGEIAPATTSNGLVIQNSKTVQQLFFNVAYTSPNTSNAVPMIELCNANGGEISSFVSTAKKEAEAIELPNSRFTVRSIQDIISGIKEKKICVYSERYANGPYSDTLATATDNIKETTYVFNTQALLEQIQPRITGYLQGPRFGSFVYCG